MHSFVSACSVCALNKVSTQPNSGLMRPLPMPRHPWSHGALDSVTGLPTSEDKTTILPLIASVNLPVLLPLTKLPSSWSGKSSVSLDSLQTLCPTAALSSPLLFGGPSVLPLGPHMVYPQASTHGLKAKLTELIRNWKLHSTVWCPITPPHGFLSLLRWSTPTTHCHPLPQVCHDLSACLVINHLFCYLRKETSLFLLLNTTSVAVMRPGTRPKHPSSTLLAAMRDKSTITIVCTCIQTRRQGMASYQGLTS